MFAWMGKLFKYFSPIFQPFACWDPCLQTLSTPVALSCSPLRLCHLSLARRGEGVDSKCETSPLKTCHLSDNLIRLKLN